LTVETPAPLWYLYAHASVSDGKGSER